MHHAKKRQRRFNNIRRTSDIRVGCLVEDQRVDCEAGAMCAVESRVGGELPAVMGAKRGTSTEEHRAAFESNILRNSAALDNTTTMAAHCYSSRDSNRQLPPECKKVLMIIQR